MTRARLTLGAYAPGSRVRLVDPTIGWAAIAYSITTDDGVTVVGLEPEGGARTRVERDGRNPLIEVDPGARLRAVDTGVIRTYGGTASAVGVGGV